MYPHQRERLTDALGRHALEAVIASAPANLAYVTGAATTSGDRVALVVVAPSGSALVVPAGRERSEPAAAGVDHVVPYRAGGAGAAIAAALAALGASDGPIGLDTGGLRPAEARAIAAGVGGRDVVEGSGVMLEARQVKGPWEIQAIERALVAAEHGLNEVVQRLESGMTELEATALFEEEASRRGATPRVSRIVFGAATADLAAPPSARRLGAGDLVRLDVGCVADGYHADVARTAVMGTAGARESSVVDALDRGVEAAIAAIRPGAPARAVAHAAIEAIRAGGLPGYTLPAVGHGIGLDLREPPVLEAASEVPLETEMVLVIDLPYAEPGWGGARLTETVLVTRAGGRALNRSQRGLLVL